MARKSLQEINAGSMADIAFLLLIFFLVTTTMSTDMGIVRKLPPITDTPPVDKHKRDILNVRINRDDKIMIQGNYVKLSDIKLIAKEFIENPENLATLPEKKEVEFDEIGKLMVTSGHVISLINDRGTSYWSYVAVQNELAAAYNELRNELALKTWQVDYEDLSTKQKKAIDKVYGMKISEADPVNVASR